MEFSYLNMCVCNTGNNFHLVTIVVTDPQKGTYNPDSSSCCLSPPHSPVIAFWALGNYIC